MVLEYSILLRDIILLALGNPVSSRFSIDLVHHMWGVEILSGKS